jgi:hypothetical protein
MKAKQSLKTRKCLLGGVNLQISQTVLFVEYTDRLLTGKNGDALQYKYCYGQNKTMV